MVLISIQESFKKLTHIKWDDLEEVAKFTPEILNEIAGNKKELELAILNIKSDCELFSLSEHYDILDKLVIFSDKASEVRLRLHIFLPGYFDRPHNHRWNYTSLILKGEYKPTIYEYHGNEENFEINKLSPILIRKETKGSYYTLHNSVRHSVVAEPYTISLVARGPSVKDKFLVSDKKTNKSWWQYGAAKELDAEKMEKMMTKNRLDYLLAKLKEMQVI